VSTIDYLVIGGYYELYDIPGDGPVSYREIKLSTRIKCVLEYKAGRLERP